MWGLRKFIRHRLPDCVIRCDVMYVFLNDSINKIYGYSLPMKLERAVKIDANLKTFITAEVSSTFKTDNCVFQNYFQSSS